MCVDQKHPDTVLAGTGEPWTRFTGNMPKVPSSVQILGNAMVGPEYSPGVYSVRIIKEN